MDVFAPSKRSQVMAAIQAKNTKPEMAIRKALHKLGYRYVLHESRLPGKPDLVFLSQKVVLQVRGCFWHGHTCLDGHIPKSRVDYWKAKLYRNKVRDRHCDRKLRALGWCVLTVWECRCNSSHRLANQINRIQRVLESRRIANTAKQALPR